MCTVKRLQAISKMVRSEALRNNCKTEKQPMKYSERGDVRETIVKKKKKVRRSNKTLICDI